MSSNQLDSEALVKEITKLEKNLKRLGYDNLIAELRGLSHPQLLERMQKQAVHRQEIADAKASDQDLKAAKRHASDLAAPYNDQTRMCDKLSRFIHLLSQE